jgi:hypothetical protein
MRFTTKYNYPLQKFQKQNLVKHNTLFFKKLQFTLFAHTLASKSKRIVTYQI